MVPAPCRLLGRYQHDEQGQLGCRIGPVMCIGGLRKLLRDGYN